LNKKLYRCGKSSIEYHRLMFRLAYFRGMKKCFILAALFLVSILVFAQPVPTPEFPFKMTVQQYLEKYAPIAVEEMHRSRIPASITLAQGLLESGNGNSRLAIVGNNHFGIKCKKDWQGETLNEDDDAPQECFRKYKAPIDSYRDHSEFLRKSPRYAFLFDLELTDYKSWAHGLKKAGYATNPKYGDILIATIEKNNLQRYDLLKPDAQEEQKIVEEKKEFIAEHKNLIINNIPAMVAKSTDSYTSIALEHDMRVWQIYKYNDLNKTAQINKGDTIYLKPKNYKSLTQEFHILQPWETMHTVAQRYGIKLSKLRAKNLLKEGQEAAMGETIYLRDKRKQAPLIKPPLAVAVPVDTMYNNEVYDDPKKNIETSGPVVPHDPYSLEEHGIKEDMAFFHTVQIGETIFSIAKKYNVQVEGIRSLNNIRGEQIKAGDKLIINPNQPAIIPKEEAVVPGYHEVQTRETLYSIARRYNITVAELKALNDLTGDTIKVGEELVVIPLNGEKPAEEKVTDNTSDEPIYHTVKEKETLYSIGRKYGVSPEELRTLNNLIDNTIAVGQQMRVR
jgi:LysM repeat protein